MIKTYTTIAAAVALTAGSASAALTVGSTLDTADISGSTVTNIAGTNGTITGTLTAASGINGIGQGLTGFSDSNYISYGNNFGAGTTDYSVGFFYKLDANVSGADFLAGKGNTGSTNPGWSIFMEGTSIIVRADAAGGSGSTNLGLSTAYVADGNWHHIGFRLDHTAGLMTAFHDGLSSGVTGTDNGWAVGGGGGDVNTFTAGDDFSAAGDLQFGRRNVGGASFNATGAGLDEINIYNEALSDAQFAAMAVPEPSSTALLGLGGLALILRRRK